MCLVISKKFHPDLQPKIAETDLLVVKCLATWKTHKVVSLGRLERTTKYCTPYIGLDVKFNEKGVAVLSADDAFQSHKPLSLNNGGEFQENGIHSYSFNAVNYNVIHVLRCHNWECFDAVIPKGTKYYVGICNDYVSEKLIIYETLNFDVRKNAKHT